MKKYFKFFYFLNKFYINLGMNRNNEKKYNLIIYQLIYYINNYKYLK